MKHQLETTHTPQQVSKGIKEIFSKITKAELVENVFLLLLCRICFMEYLVSPFGVSMFAVLFHKTKRPSYVIFSTLGVLLTGNPTFYFKYIGTILIVLAVTLIFSTELKTKKNAVLVLTTSALFVNGFVYVFAEGLFLYDFLMLLLECGMCYLAFFVFSKAVGSLSTIAYRTVYEPSELVSLVLLCACGILSIALIESLLPVAHILSITIILFLALTCGFSISTPAGAVLSLAMGLSTPYPAQIVCAYTFASLFAGLVATFGRLAVSGIFAVCTFVVTWLLFPESNGLLTVSYVAVSCLVLFFVPDKILLSFGTAATKPRIFSRSNYRLHEAVRDSFTNTIDTVNSVSDIFHDIVESCCEKRTNSYDAVFDSTAEAVCANCSLCRFCWHKEKNKTVSLLQRMITVMESKNVLAKKDIPKEFSEMCIRCESFISELNKNFESLKVTKMWSGKVNESKKLVAEQFKNISMILENMQENLEKKMNYEPKLEAKIIAALDKLGVSLLQLRLSCDDGFCVEIHNPEFRINTTPEAIADSLSDILEVPMLAEKKHGNVLKFYQKPEFSADIFTQGIARKNAQICGDNCAYFPFATGKIAIILSDGMGSGNNANFQSSVVVELAKKLLTAGIKSETCVRLINNILMTNADKETFATVDLCVINLYSGIMEFVKTGASSSYIKKEKEDVTITSTSLPAGLIPVVDADFSIKYAADHDTLIMASDGVTDVLDTNDKNEIFDLAKDDDTCQELSQKILNHAISRSGGVALDDMTVCVCKLSKI